MSEELEKKEKPKATLIKHSKQESNVEAQKSDKKKVVVVKKKKKPVAKAVHKNTDANSQGDKGQEENTAAKREGKGNFKNNLPKIGKSEGRPAGGSRKGRSQDDIFAKKPSETVTSDNQNSRENKSPAQSEDIRKPSNNTGGSTYSRQQSSDNRNGQDDRRTSGYRQGSGQRNNYQQNGTSQDRSGGNQRSGGYQGGRPNYNRNDSQGGRPNYNRNDSQGGRPNYNRNDSQGGRPGGNYRPGGTGNRPANQNYQGRSGDNRNNNRPGGYNSRPNNFRGNSSGPGGRPGGFKSRPSTGAPSVPTEENKKSTGRKVFKTKKKVDYKKKNDFEKEKDFQIKKKTVQRINPVPSEIEMLEAITVSDLARKMNLKASELIAKLMGMGMMVTINKQIDVETAELLAAEYDCKIKRVSLYDETIIESEKVSEGTLQTRAPIVAVMGHVDHGKTKLLDAIKKTDIVAIEHGGITQHIGASKVAVDGGSIVFLDTPGHEAFTLMRARGAKVTDIVVLIVAANDGVMPQTVEAINHAKEAGVPIVVAINKCDLPDANIDRVKQQLSEYNLMPESWGGTTLFAEISALKGTGIKELLDIILLQAEILELKATPDCRAEGTVIESKVDQGRGIVSSVIIERGTLRVGDSFVAGIYHGKVRALFDDKGDKLDEAGPSTPVEILGFTGVPSAGAPFQVTENEKTARMVGEKRQELEKLGRADGVAKITLDNLYASIQEGSILELKVIIKGDVHGSVEALQSSLKKLSTDEIKLTPIHCAAGAIVENDVNLASASNAIIIGFHVRPTPKALLLAEREKVDIRKYNIIYDAVADIKSAMEGMLAPELSEETLGTVEVREVFKVPKIGLIAGCYVKTGKVRRGENAHVIREGVILHSGKITSLKRFKDDAKEVDAGYECGIGIENYLDVQEGDEFEVYSIKETARNLD